MRHVQYSGIIESKVLVGLEFGWSFFIKAKETTQNKKKIKIDSLKNKNKNLRKDKKKKQRKCQKKKNTKKISTGSR